MPAARIRQAFTIAVGCSSLLAAPLVAHSEPKLALRVSPHVAAEPAFLTVRATIDSHADNRELEIVVECPTFYRSSRITLAGANAPRLNVFELRGVPSGVYEVRAVLIGSEGPRARSLQLVKIVPSPAAR